MIIKEIAKKNVNIWSRNLGSLISMEEQAEQRRVARPIEKCTLYEFCNEKMS